ncbi:hypothetical protein [Thermococcus sp.]
MRREMFAIVAVIMVLVSTLASGCIESRKIEGQMHSLGTFNASSLEVKGVVGEVVIERRSSAGISVETTLPLEYINGSTLKLYCPRENGRNKCNDYRNGLVIIKVGKALNSLTIVDSVGGIKSTVDAGNIEASNIVGRFRLELNTSGLTMSNIVGDIKFKGSLRRVRIDNTVGMVELELRGAESISIEDIVGDIDIKVPSGSRVHLSMENSINLKPEIDESIYNGTEPLEISIHRIIGRVKIEK